MIDDDAMKISDEMLAAYLDGNCTPLERLVIGDSLADESMQEFEDLVSDSKDAGMLEQVEDLWIEDMVERLTRPFQEYGELKNGLERPDRNPIM